MVKRSVRTTGLGREGPERGEAAGRQRDALKSVRVMVTIFPNLQTETLWFYHNIA